MLKEVIDDALARGERLKRDIVAQILKSATLNELINNRRFEHTIARIIQTKDGISQTIQRNVQDALRAMRIPSKQDIGLYERKVNQLERKIDTLTRQIMKRKLKSNGSARRHKS